MSQWDIIEAIRVQHLEHARVPATPAGSLSSGFTGFQWVPSFVPFADLTFVLETKDPNVLHEIHLAEQNYRACAQALQIRNQELQKFYDNPRVSHHVRDFETGAGVAAASDRDSAFSPPSNQTASTSLWIERRQDWSRPHRRSRS